MNQDNYYVNGRYSEDPNQKEMMFSEDYNNGIFAVADGMGGESDGEFASLTTVQSLKELSAEQLPETESVSSCIDKANNKICEKVKETGKRSGTTIAMAAVNDIGADIYNIGDSKVFLYSKGSLTQLSKDHTVTAQMVEAGLITKEQAKKDRRSHQLFQHIGIAPEEMKISLYEQKGISLEPDDIIIICSDGMTDGLENEDIIDIIENNAEYDILARELAERAIENGSKDNVTVLTVMKNKNESSTKDTLLNIIICICVAILGTAAGYFITRLIIGLIS